MTKKTQDYYIASAKCREVKAFNGNVLTKDGTVIWLGTSDGYPACERGKANAKKWESPEEITENAHRWDGMPWYCQLKPGTLRIFHVVERRTCVRTETACP